MPEQTNGGVRQLGIGPALWPHLEKWLNNKGYLTALMPHTNPDDLPTYIVIPR